MLVNVAIGIAEEQGKILLIKRERGDFVNLWALPGGKIEQNEHVDNAVEREFQEETGSYFKFEGLLGTCTEIMHDKDNTSILNICRVKKEDKKEIQQSNLKWFSKKEIEEAEDIVESDKVFIQEFLYKKEKNYLKLDCYRKEDGKYYWK